MEEKTCWFKKKNGLILEEKRAVSEEATDNFIKINMLIQRKEWANSENNELIRIKECADSDEGMANFIERNVLIPKKERANSDEGTG